MPTSQQDNFIGSFYISTTPPNASIDQAGRDAFNGEVYVDNRTTQSGVTAGGSLMIRVGSAWYGVNLTTSTSTTTTTTTTSTTTS